MTEKLSKREFVDKYPYIVYTGENDTSSDDLKVKSGSITSDDLADGAVTTGKIANGAVTAGKLAEGAIPTASADTLGGVKVGDGLSITEAGVLSASGGGSGGAVFDIDYTGSAYTIDATYNDVVNADFAVFKINNSASEFKQITNYRATKSPYIIFVDPSYDNIKFTAQSADGELVYTPDED